VTGRTVAGAYVRFRAMWLRKLHIQSINLVRADVAHREYASVRSHARPGSPDTAEMTQIVPGKKTLRAIRTELEAVHRRLSREETFNVHLYTAQTLSRVLP
jgi:hypothetical protein